MTDTTFIEKLDFDRAKSVHDISNTSCDETNVYCKPKTLVLDLVYFNKDEKKPTVCFLCCFKRLILTNFTSKITSI